MLSWLTQVVPLKPHSPPEGRGFLGCGQEDGATGRKVRERLHCWLGRCRKGPRAKAGSGPWKLEQARRQTVPPEPPEAASPADMLSSAQGDRVRLCPAEL